MYSQSRETSDRSDQYSVSLSFCCEVICQTVSETCIQRIFCRQYFLAVSTQFGRHDGGVPGYRKPRPCRLVSFVCVCPDTVNTLYSSCIIPLDRVSYLTCRGSGKGWRTTEYYATTRLCHAPYRFTFHIDDKPLYALERDLNDLSCVFRDCVNTTP